MTMHSFLKSIAIVLTLTVAPFAISTARAVCIQSNLAGVWHDYALSHYSGTVAECTFRIDTKGNLTASSVCYNYTGTTNLPPVRAISGNFKLNASCGVAGNLGGDNGVNAFFKGQLDKSKTTLAGISRNSTGNIALHHFVKQ
jgi:hypothetical protein